MRHFRQSFSVAFDETLQLSHRAVDLQPLNAVRWESIEEIELFIGQLDEAVADRKKVFELNTDNWNGHFFLSEILFEDLAQRTAIRRGLEET